MNNDILVSVIMPSYNSGKYIKDSINSVLNQTYKNIELIIVDDCSKDESVKIIESFDDSRIRLFKNEQNSGAAFSRNLAIRSSGGSFIAFLDSDDVWKENKVEKQLEFMLSNNYDFSYTNFELMDLDGKSCGKYVIGPKHPLTKRDFIKTNYVGCLTIMYKKSIYPNLQIPNDILKRNDYALWILLSQKSNCYHMDEILSFYRKGNSGLSSSKFKLLKNHYHLYRNLLKFNPIHSFFCVIRNVYYNFYRKIFMVKKYE